MEREVVDRGQDLMLSGGCTPPQIISTTHKIIRQVAALLAVSTCPRANRFRVIRPSKPDSTLPNIDSVPKRLSSRITRRELRLRTVGLAQCERQGSFPTSLILIRKCLIMFHPNNPNIDKLVGFFLRHLYWTKLAERKYSKTPTHPPTHPHTHTHTL